MFLHCFGVSGSTEAFKETFEGRTKFVNITESSKHERDVSIDLKFDDKQEAINFIKLSQSTVRTIIGRTLTKLVAW